MDDVMEPDDGMVELEPSVAEALRAVPPADPNARSSAITAALDSVDAAVVTLASARSRRVKLMSSITAAAAAVVLVVAGIAVTNSGGDDSADSSGAIDQATLEAASEMAVEAPERDVAEASEAAAADEPAEEPAAEQYALEEDDVIGDAPKTDGSLPVIENDSELIDQTDLLASQVAEGRVDPPATECVMIGGGPVGVALFEGREVVLFRDLASGTYTALSADDCSPVVQVTTQP